MTDIEVAQQAKAANMKAVLIKSHVTCTADRAQIASKVADFPVFGGIALNYPVGGINPAAVDTAFRLGAKEVWMPTIHAAHYLTDFGHAPLFSKVLHAGIKGIGLLNNDGTLKQEVLEVVELIAQNDGILGTGHISPKEAMALVPAAKKMGVRKIMITHPLSPLLDYSVADLREMLSRGATMLEHNLNDTTQSLQHPISPAKIADAIKAVGAATVVMSTDTGQMHNPAPVAAMEIFIGKMLDLGISRQDIAVMTADNPAKMLGI